MPESLCGTGDTSGQTLKVSKSLMQSGTNRMSSRNYFRFSGAKTSQRNTRVLARGGGAGIWADVRPG